LIQTNIYSDRGANPRASTINTLVACYYLEESELSKVEAKNLHQCVYDGGDLDFDG